MKYEKNKTRIKYVPLWHMTHQNIIRVSIEQ